MFGLFNNDGCGSHHWGEWKTRNNFDIKKGGHDFKIAKEQYRECLHECDATERRWQTVRTIRRGALGELLKALSLFDKEVDDKDITLLLCSIANADEPGIERGLFQVWNAPRRYKRDDYAYTATVDIEPPKGVDMGETED